MPELTVELYSASLLNILHDQQITSPLRLNKVDFWFCALHTNKVQQIENDVH